MDVFMDVLMIFAIEGLAKPLEGLPFSQTSQRRPPRLANFRIRVAPSLLQGQEHVRPLQGLPPAAMKAEIGRQVHRAEDRTTRLLGGADKVQAMMAVYFRAVQDERKKKDKKPMTDADALDNFVTLCRASR